MNKYIINFILRYIIKQLKILNNNINIVIKYLSSSRRFSNINKYLRKIKDIIIYLKSTRIYKIYKYYNTSIKFITF